MDTIFALATAAGRAGVAIIRISGPEALRGLAAFGVNARLGGRCLAKLRGPEGVIDEALVLHFPEGQSFTGDESVEIHCHGSPAVVAAIQRILTGVPGLRRAVAGEFTRRAFETGRLSLDQVEALADLIDAETEQQRAISVGLFGGSLKARADGWRRDLLRVSALLMAGIDFADEEIPDSVLDEARGVLTALSDDLGDAIARSQGVERVWSGFEIALVGAPNSGKSTLLNRLAGRDVAITSSTAGTTRDIVEVRVDLDGVAATFLDTAGVRKTDDPVEAVGVERTRQRAAAADLRVFLETDEDVDVPWREGDVVLAAKDDHGASGGVSGLTGAGVDVMLREISAALTDRVPRDPVLGRARQIEEVTQAKNAVDEAIDMLELDVALASDSVSTAARKMDMVVGRLGVEDVLDEVFSSFCIGK